MYTAMVQICLWVQSSTGKQSLIMQCVLIRIRMSGRKMERLP